VALTEPQATRCGQCCVLTPAASWPGSPCLQGEADPGPTLRSSYKGLGRGQVPRPGARHTPEPLASLQHHALKHCSGEGDGSWGAQCNPGVSTPLPTPRLLSKILSECEDADEIEYLVDGSWCPIRAEKERSCSPQCPILVLGEATHLFLGLVSRPTACLSETRLSRWSQSL